MRKFRLTVHCEPPGASRLAPCPRNTQVVERMQAKKNLLESPVPRSQLLMKPFRPCRGCRCPKPITEVVRLFAPQHQWEERLLLALAGIDWSELSTLHDILPLFHPVRPVLSCSTSSSFFTRRPVTAFSITSSLGLLLSLPRCRVRLW